MILKTLKEVAHFLSEAGIPYMVIGGQAVLQYGEPRFTQDIDITIGLIPEELGKALDALPQEIFRLLPEDVEGFVQDTWVLPLEHRETGVRVGLIFPMTSFEREAIESAREILIDNMPIHYISPEDLIVQKIVSGRPRDLEDAKSILEIQGERIDKKRIERTLEALATEAEEAEWSELPRPYGRGFLVRRRTARRLLHKQHSAAGGISPGVTSRSSCGSL